MRWIGEPDLECCAGVTRAGGPQTLDVKDLYCVAAGRELPSDPDGNEVALRDRDQMCPNHGHSSRAEKTGQPQRVDERVAVGSGRGTPECIDCPHGTSPEQLRLVSPSSKLC